MRRRFVVQRHEVAPGDVHFDLMVEEGEVLVTFQLEAAPAGDDAAVSGSRSFDHRKKYLTYEGPISGDRGSVTIWDSGELDDVEGALRSALWCASFSGRRLAGRYLLSARGPEEGAAIVFQRDLRPRASAC